MSIILNILFEKVAKVGHTEVNTTKMRVTAAENIIYQSTFLFALYFSCFLPNSLEFILGFLRNCYIFSKIENISACRAWSST